MANKREGPNRINSVRNTCRERGSSSRGKCATRRRPKGAEQGQAIRCRTDIAQTPQQLCIKPPENQRAAGRGGSNPVDSWNPRGKQGLPKEKWLAPRTKGHVHWKPGSPLDLVLFRLKGETPRANHKTARRQMIPKGNGKIKRVPSTDGGRTWQKGQAETLECLKPNPRTPKNGKQNHKYTHRHKDRHAPIEIYIYTHTDPHTM